VLNFEREVVMTLVGRGADTETTAAIEAYVDTTLRSMPEHLRAGVAAESMMLGALHRAHAAFRPRTADLGARLEHWKNSRIDLIRQYVRLFESLVLFASHELAPDPAA
jgi:hypothetical protein